MLVQRWPSFGAADNDILQHCSFDQSQPSNCWMVVARLDWGTETRQCNFDVRRLH